MISDVIAILLYWSLPHHLYSWLQGERGLRIRLLITTTTATKKKLEFMAPVP